MKIAIVSTYPPRPCGIGTFSADLRAALLLADPANEVNVVSIVSEEVRPASAPRDRHQTGLVTSSLRNHPPEVSASLRQNVREDYAAAARMLSADGTDVVLIEHEYGIFGGEAGEFVLSLVSELHQPVVVTLHTVLSRPSAAQTATLNRLCELATLVTVFTETARRMVVESQTVAAEKVRVVSHGAPAVLVAREMSPTADGTEVVEPWPAARSRAADVALRRRLQGRTVLSTFGLISSGKGIELALDAVAQVVRRHPDVLYLIAGQSHPEVVKHEGETYRRGLERQVAELGLRHHVLFLDRFLAIDELAALLFATDLYVTPYRSKEQIVSGALTFAVAAGCPVVSTPYFYAEDLLSSGAGVLVPFDDPDAMAAAISDLLDSPSALAAARAKSAEVGSRMSWSSVGRVTLDALSDAVATGRPPVVAAVSPEPALLVRRHHLLVLSDDVGIIQHADVVVPCWSSGYCVDDSARLVLVALRLGDRLPSDRSRSMISAGLALLRYAWDPAVPGLHNFLGYDRRWSDDAGGGDHVGRAVWTLGEVIAAQPPTGEARPSLRLLASMEPYLDTLTSLRTVAFALLGLVRPDPHLLPVSLLALRRQLAAQLADAFDAHASPEWRWFEPYLTYDNARLPQALIAAGSRLGDDALVERGLNALEWYAGQCCSDSGVRLIGNRWRQQGEIAPADDGDEQPLDAAALAEAAVEAYRVTGDAAYSGLARAAFGWFLGANRWGIPVYDVSSGGCHDGLSAAGVNDNEGAESTLSFWQALLALEGAGLQQFTVSRDTPTGEAG
jgi:glycosyltransferase involved in cell wall biosynthesis